MQKQRKDLQYVPTNENIKYFVKTFIPYHSTINCIKVTLPERNARVLPHKDVGKIKCAYENQKLRCLPSEFSKPNDVFLNNHYILPLARYVYNWMLIV